MIESQLVYPKIVASFNAEEDIDEPESAPLTKLDPKLLAVHCENRRNSVSTATNSTGLQSSIKNVFSPPKSSQSTNLLQTYNWGDSQTIELDEEDEQY